MQAFIQHVGSPGNVDVPYTIGAQRSIAEMLRLLPASAPERKYFQSDPMLKAAFPNGSFNCWGVPPGAQSRFAETNIGDLILVLPRAGMNGALEHVGLVLAKCPLDAWNASRILWPATASRGLLYPHIFFFDSESGFRYWSDFVSDLSFDENWNPKGWYRRVADWRFDRWGGPQGYLQFLRRNCGFK
jgi:hypothetical protein